MREQVEEIKKQYPPGTRIRLIKMVDPYPMPDGSEGTVDHIDDAGQLHMKWDNGSTLAVNTLIDTIEIIENTSYENTK